MTVTDKTVFTPDEVEDMGRELEQGDRPDESGTERELRAAEIVRRKAATHVGEANGH